MKTVLITGANRGTGGAIDATTSVAGMRKFIKEAPRSLKQYFYNYDGTPHDW